jgi:serine/threonine protein kinase
MQPVSPTGASGERAGPAGGDVIAGGRFRIEHRLDRGGMGIVYRAFDRDRDGPVALKLLQTLRPDSILRFKREFRALCDVTHPNLVSLYELVSDEGRWFFTMELLDGVDLRTFVVEGSHLSTPLREATPTVPDEQTAHQLSSQTGLEKVSMD